MTAVRLDPERVARARCWDRFRDTKSTDLGAACRAGFDAGMEFTGREEAFRRDERVVSAEAELGEALDVLGILCVQRERMTRHEIEVGLLELKARATAVLRKHGRLP